LASTCGRLLVLLCPSVGLFFDVNGRRLLFSGLMLCLGRLLLCCMMLCLGWLLLCPWREEQK
jgi:ABC-type transport system involved in cytochrome c biogenesis permease component